jgi:hypothetical protein
LRATSRLETSVFFFRSGHARARQAKFVELEARVSAAVKIAATEQPPWSNQFWNYRKMTDEIIFRLDLEHSKFVEHGGRKSSSPTMAGICLKSRRILTSACARPLDLM